MQEEKKAKGKSEAKLTGTNADLRALKVTEANDMLRCADIALKLPVLGVIATWQQHAELQSSLASSCLVDKICTPEVCSPHVPSCLLHLREACGTSCCRPVLTVRQCRRVSSYMLLAPVSAVACVYPGPDVQTCLLSLVLTLASSKRHSSSELHFTSLAGAIWWLATKGPSVLFSGPAGIVLAGGDICPCTMGPAFGNWPLSNKGNETC